MKYINIIPYLAKMRYVSSPRLVANADNPEYMTR